MPKMIIAVILMILSSATFCQLKSSNEIVAEGGAKTKVRPDIAAFTLTVEKTDTIEKSAIVRLNKTVDEVIKSLNLLGFRNENIKIANYDISSSSDDEDRRKRYTASNTLKITFPINNKLIDAFYSEIQEAGIEDLEVSFETNISDSLEKATRLRLVHQAVDDAKINAANIARTLGIRISKVKQVHKYGEAVLDATKIEMAKFTPTTMMRDTKISYNSSFDKFQVEDIELEERITIVYEIQN